MEVKRRLNLSYKFTCAVCRNKEVKVTQLVERIPYFGAVAIITFICESCGFKMNDIVCLEFQEPREYVLRVESEEDLKAKIIKSSTGFIEIPELKVEVRPGSASQGFISNVEGLLVRVEETAEVLASEGDVYENFILKLKDAKKAKIPFTVILRDPYGNSAIISERKNVVVRKLSDLEVKRLKEFLIG
ncbi:MAG: ZPR1 zinc finger domain-containing protein [Candidatus Bathyarchaeota archaeon]|nr:ZPR1 zinc finger domain-containing protein [Candidatus Bathyarchaeota archaeon]